VKVQSAIRIFPVKEGGRAEKKNGDGNSRLKLRLQCGTNIFRKDVKGEWLHKGDFGGGMAQVCIWGSSEYR